MQACLHQVDEDAQGSSPICRALQARIGEKPVNGIIYNLGGAPLGAEL